MSEQLETPRRQEELELLRKQVANQHEEVRALLRCLADSGVLRMTTFQAKLHRQRFTAMCSLHPCKLDASFGSTLHVDGIAARVASFASLIELRMARAASPGTSCLVREVWPHATLLPALHICICGGSPDGVQSLSSAQWLGPVGSPVPAWKGMPPMLECRQGAAAVALAGRLYVCGGRPAADAMPLRSVECFDPDVSPGNGQWEELEPMQVAREGAAACAVSGRLYVCGGWNHEDHHLSSVESAEFFESHWPTEDGLAYEAATVGVNASLLGTWELLAPMAQQRGRPAVAAVGGSLYVCGGWDSQRRLSSVECLDAAASVPAAASLGGASAPHAGASAAWRPIAPMAQTRDAATAAAAGGRLYVCGGWSSNSISEALNTVERYDPSCGTWEAAPPMLIGRCGAAMVSAAGRLFVMGGYSGRQYLNTIEQLDLVRYRSHRVSLALMSERDGLNRKMKQFIFAPDATTRCEWKIGDLLAVWWCPSFEGVAYPYLPQHVTRPKECIKIYQVSLPERCVFEVPPKERLVAVPFFDIFDEPQAYGPMLGNAPQLASKYAMSLHDLPQKS